jgi:fibronectin-binding autotransporter adhesin
MNTKRFSSNSQAQIAKLCIFHPPRLAFWAASLALLLTFNLDTASLHAQTWTGATSGNFGTSTNWSSTPGFTSTTDLIFDATSANSTTASPSFLGAARTIRSITFGADADTDFMTLLATTSADSTAANLQMGSNSINASIVVDPGATGNFQLGGNSTGTVRLDGNLLVDHNGSGNLTIKGISTQGAAQVRYITKNGSGTLVLGSGTNVLNLYQGGLILNTGTVVARQYSDILGEGTATLTLNGGVLKFSNASGLSFGRNTTVAGETKIITSNSGGGAGLNYTLGALSIGSNTLSVDGQDFASGTGQVTFGATTLTGNAIVNVAKPTSGTGNTNLNLGAVGDGGSGYGITKNGNGSLTINGTSTFTGKTIVNAGTLVIGVAGAINSSSSVSVASGATLSNNNTLTALSSALILNPGASLSGSGAFAPVAMTLVADLTGGNGSFSSINAGTTSLTKSGGMEFTLSNMTDGSYVVFSGSALSGSFSSVTVGGVALSDLGSGNFGGTVGGFDYAFTNSTNTLGITTVPEPTTWTLVGLGGVLLIFRVLKSRQASASEASASRV